MSPHIIRVIDFETTGMEPPAEVIEVGTCDLINSGDGWEVQDPGGYLCRVASCPPEVRAVHHITVAEVADAEPFDAAALLDACAAVNVIAAHNMEFEAKFIGPTQLPTLCTYKAALRVWPDAPGHSNGALRYWLQDQGLISPDHAKTLPPHRAAPDAYVTAHILKALLAQATAREMVAWTQEPRLLPTLPIGKQKGAKWADVDRGFLDWMLKQESMEADLKWNARREIERREAVAA